MRQTASIAVLLFISYSVRAQSDYDFSQRWFNEFIFNPAAAGSSFTSSAFVHARQQWVGMSGAPSTQAASFDTYVESMNSGFGLSLVTDRFGLVSSNTVRLGYAYMVPTGERSLLAFGLSAGILNRSRRANDGVIENPSDPSLAYGNASETTPDFDIGAEYKGAFKFGLSVRHIGIKQSFRNFPPQSINVWSYLSSRFNLNNFTSIEPVASFTAYSSVYRFEAGALFYFLKNEDRNTYNERYWLGGMVRHNGDVSLLAGVHLTSKIKLGYSFDYGVSQTRSLSKFGSHELMLSYQFNRMFYKEPLCPAYRTSRVNRKK